MLRKNGHSPTLFVSDQTREFTECLEGLERSISYNKKALVCREELITADHTVLLVIRDDLNNTSGFNTEDLIRKSIEEHTQALRIVTKMKRDENISSVEYESLLTVDGITRFQAIKNYPHVQDINAGMSSKGITKK